MVALIHGVKEMINIYDFIKVDKLDDLKKSLKPGDDKVIYEDEKLKITLKKRGRKVYTFIDEFSNNNINEILQKVVNLA